MIGDKWQEYISKAESPPSKETLETAKGAFFEGMRAAFCILEEELKEKNGLTADILNIFIREGNESIRIMLSN